MQACKPRFHRSLCTDCRSTVGDYLGTKHPFSLLIAIAIFLAMVGLPTSVAAGSTLNTNRESLAFGNVVVGNNSKQTITLTNYGKTSVSISRVSVSGSGFSESGLATPLTLAAGRSITFAAHFAPKVLGTEKGSITIASNASDPLLTITLGGTGVKQLSLSPEMILFGGVAMGNKSQHAVTLTNYGKTSVSISRVSVSGSGFSESGLATPLTLAAGRSITFAAHFAPKVLGTEKGSITIASNASDPLLTITLGGTGVKQLSLSPEMILFGGVAMGNKSQHAVTLTNYGKTSVSISRVSVSGSGFSESGLATPLTLAAGRSITFAAHFAPKVLGTEKGSITIASNASDPLLTITLGGTGVKQLSLSPEMILFGGVAMGNKSQHAVTLTNYGKTSVSISRVSVSGSGFSESGLATPLTLAAGRSITFTAHFAPKVLGTEKGSITIASNASDPLLTIALGGTGTGVLGSLSATPSSASFGKVAMRNTNSQPIRLNNTGSGSVTISSANVSGKGFRIAGLTIPLTIASGRSATFDVMFEPIISGSVAGWVSLVSNGTDSPFTIPLGGTGVEASFLLGANPSSVNFGPVKIDSSSSWDVTLTNHGNSNVTISSVLVLGAGFSKSSAITGVTLTPTQSATLKLEFAPTKAGSATGSVTITSNATNSPAKIALSATGALQDSHSVTLRWDPSTSSGIVGYYVYRGTEAGGPYSKVNSSAIAGTQYTDSSVQAGHTYYYVVRSVESNGVQSSYSAQVSAIVPTP